MEVCAVKDYIFYDFIEDFLGYSLKGSGRIVKVSRELNEVEVNVKRFKMGNCINHNFTFIEDKCYWSRNYWHNEDITSYWQNFLSENEKSI